MWIALDTLESIFLAFGENSAFTWNQCYEKRLYDER